MPTSFWGSHVAPNALPMPFATSCGAPMNEVPQNVLLLLILRVILYRTSVRNDLPALGVGVWPSLDSGHFELEVGGRGQRHGVDQWTTVRRVETSIRIYALIVLVAKLLKISLNTSGHIVLISLMLEEDGEKRLIHELLIDRVDEGWSNLIDGERGKGQA